MKATALFINKKASSWDSLCIKEEWGDKSSLCLYDPLFPGSYIETQEHTPTHLYCCCFASQKSKLCVLSYLVYLKGKKLKIILTPQGSARVVDT